MDSSCFHCKASLSGQKFVKNNDKPYCSKCYEKLFSQTCESCKEIIQPGVKYLKSEDLHWHEKCFNCSGCQKSLVDADFHTVDKKRFCNNCHEKKFADNCGICGQVIKGTALTYNDKSYHGECFTCNHCAETLAGKKFSFKGDKRYCEECFDKLLAKKCFHCSKTIEGQFASKEEKSYCLGCYNQLFAKPCAGCNKIIGLTGVGGSKSVTYEDRHWHPECFQCYRCKASLDGKKFLLEGTNIVCPTCK